MLADIFAMDDITNRRFERVEEKIAGVRVTLDEKIESVRATLVTLDEKIESVRVTLGQKIENVRVDIETRVETVGRGLDVALNAGFTAGFKAAAEQRRELHAETMRKFQQVIDEAERAGAMAARDRRMSVLEDDVTDLRGRLTQLEKVVTTGEGHPDRTR